jgi:hypothetical protein
MNHQKKEIITRLLKLYPRRYSKIVYQRQVLHSLTARLLKRFISKPVIEELSKRIDHTANIARRDGFAELIEEITISLAFARHDQEHLLRKWVSEKEVIFFC